MSHIRKENCRMSYPGNFQCSVGVEKVCPKVKHKTRSEHMSVPIPPHSLAL